MATVNVAHSDIEAGTATATTVPANSTTVRLNRRRRRRRRSRRHRPSVTASSETTTDGSFQFSDTEEDDSRSMHSHCRSGGGSYDDECSLSTTETEGISVISGSSRLGGSCTFSDDGLKEEAKKEVDLESGELELKVHRKRERRKECRICHLSFSVIGTGNSGDRRIIELGCSCKGDLGSAHNQCAETWFKIRGNTRQVEIVSGGIYFCKEEI